MEIKGKRELLLKLQKLKNLKQSYPRIAGREAVLFFKKRFDERNWVSDRSEPWKLRKDKGKKNKGRGLLVKTGALRRSIRVTRASGTMVWVGTDIPYARAHNQGYRGNVSVKEHKRNKFTTKEVGIGTYLIKSKKENTRKVSELKSEGKVEAHTRKMNLPKRQFIGESRYLLKNLERLILSEIKKIAK